ncbi:RNA-directed DNA polymerase, eukaryota, reverse transcriptase zinc-binding domain protein [Tanacetum coccineum]
MKSPKKLSTIVSMQRNFIKSFKTSNKEVRKFINEGKLHVCSIIETYVKEKIVKETCEKVIHVARQSILCHVESNQGNVNVLCTFVYASNNATERRLPWKDLYRHKRICGVNPWVIVGDMNVTLNLEEHSNVGSVITKEMQEFRDCINLIEMDDIGSSGFFYTWTKSLRNPDNTVLKKLDRVMVSEELLMRFNGSHAIFQPFFAVVDGWKTQVSGYKMYYLKLKEAQSIVEKDPYNKEAKVNVVEDLFEYDEAVKDEENLAQKARVEWLDAGDKNSSFFHKVIKGKRSRNSVDIIRDENGNSYGKDEATLQFVKHFQQFLGNHSNVSDLVYIEDLFSNVLSNDEVEEMIKEVSDKEIKDALFDIGDNKALGPDGYSFVFFKKAWNVVGKDEILRGYRRKNGPKRCAMKIELQKAYDTINWSYLETILYRFGFHSRMVGWIMQCVQTACFTICINGERHGYFKGGRGLRQVDLISPYLFTLVMEMLTLLLQRKIRNSDGFKYHHGCKELKIINLCFADDLMIFCHGDIKSAGVINDAIKDFSAVSGLHLNMNKSSLFFGSLNIIEKGQLMSVMKFKEGALPSRYLGVPLVTKRIGVKYCQTLIDREAEDWKCKSLSYAGRLLLIASILESISAYWAFVFKLPKTVIKEINGIFKRFLWSNGDSAKGKAKLAWKHVCKPKKFKGLVLKNIEDWNDALLAKHIWNIASKKDTLWVKWVHSIRLKEDIIWNVQHETGDSWNWKCLVEVRDRIASRMQFAIGDGKGIHMWTDKWQSNGLLINQISHKDLYDARLSKKTSLADMINNGSWNWPNEWNNDEFEVMKTRTPRLKLLKVFGSDAVGSFECDAVGNNEWSLHWNASLKEMNAGYGLDIRDSMTSVLCKCGVKGSLYYHKVGFLLWLEANLVMPLLLVHLVNNSEGNVAKWDCVPEQLLS